MKVGILGGSFNPAHQGHIYISNLAIKKLGLNQVWWIPTAKNPLKKAPYENYQKRLNQCNLITKNNPKIKIKEIDEIYTEKLVKKLKARYRNIDFFWIMGDESFVTLHLWKNFRRLLKLITFAVFSRETFSKIRQSKIFYTKPKALFFPTKTLKISSTAIRNNV